ncbi:MAG: hypothetical protein R3F50_13405 [Gammaproteobacteria bacterium]|jgi:tetratricopeptide (TPR) repeat protein
MAALRPLLLSWLALLVCHTSYAADLGELGRIHFPTTGSDAAQEHFLTGIAYLHSFGWKQARAEFRRAQELDPVFALAYWGESMTYNHPFYPVTNTADPARVLEKLGPTREQRLSKARSSLERNLLAAAEIPVFNRDNSPQWRQDYRLALENLSKTYPTHEEVQAFYILALLGEAAFSEPQPRQELRQRAGRLASRLLAQNDRHPGAAHYLIHSYNDPRNATLALAAADRYAEIAPVVSHARHMPSTIYLHLGRWYDVADLNETAFYTARALWRPGDDPFDQSRALDFGQYGDLQLADYEAAAMWIERAEDTLLQNPGNEQISSLLTRLRARLTVESKDWKFRPISPDMSADELLASGLSAINMRDLVVARNASLMLKDRADKNHSELALRIAHLELEASILFATNRIEAGKKTIEEAVQLTIANVADSTLPDPIKPAPELKAELLLQAGLEREAIDAFHEALTLAPFRPWSILGLARSYATAGQHQQASVYYRQLLGVWKSNDLLGVGEARTHLRIYN